MRRVAARAVPGDAPYTAELVTRAQLALIVSPGESVGPEGLHVPLSGHNVVLAVTAAGPEPVTVRAVSAAVVARGPFPGSVAVEVAHRRMPQLVLSADLLESLQRAVAAYRPLAPPDVAILLDLQPAEFAMVGEGAIAPPFDVHPGDRARVVFAPVTEARALVRWRLLAELACGDRVDTVHWDLAVTAETAKERLAPGGGRRSLTISEIHADHWDPAERVRAPSTDDIDDVYTVVAHVGPDGGHFLTAPVRPDPEPESPAAAALRREAEAHDAAGRIDAAAASYGAAAAAGSGAAAYGLGALLLERGEPETALAWHALAARRRIFPAFNDAGAAALQVGDLSQAEWWFRRAMDEGDWSGAVNLAIVCIQRGAFTEAETLLRAASRMDVPLAVDNLSWLLLEQGRADEAKEILGRRRSRGD